MAALVIRGGRVLLPDHAEPRALDVELEDGVITGTSPVGSRSHERTGDASVDATGALVLPGVIDVHGDEFERALMPRGGVSVDPAAALADNDPHMLAAGITTAFLSITDSWEPGLRSRAMLRELLEADDQRGGPQRLIHVRHERCNTDGFEELLAWVAAGRIQMVSYNDHTPGGIDHPSEITEAQAARAGVSRDELERLQAEAVARRPVGVELDTRLAAACEVAGIVTASHDAGSDDDLARDLALGVAIAEFPFTIELARRYLAHGIYVALGAPNLVRGRSHLGNLSVREAVAAGAVTMLCSDYHYPSLLRAPFTLVQHGICTLAEAWALVSSGPARAAGLDDRGRIETGARADVIVVEPPGAGAPARVRAAVVAGQLAYQVAAR